MRQNFLPTAFSQPNKYLGTCFVCGKDRWWCRFLDTWFYIAIKMGLDTAR